MNDKLKNIAKLVSLTDNIIDVGCDHAYLAIYLKKEKLCKSIVASDISPKAIENARKNIKKANLKIKAFVADGLKNITDKKIDTAIISGLGTSSILEIIENSSIEIKKYIISSNNDHETLRVNMKNKGFYIQKEVIVYEKGKYYPIMLFERIYKTEDKMTLKYGKSCNRDYYNYLLNKEKEILEKIPRKHFIKKFKMKRAIKKLAIFIERIEED